MVYIPISTFRNVYVNEADHVTEFDLNCELKMGATIMAWFCEESPSVSGNLGANETFWIRRSKHG